MTAPIQRHPGVIPKSRKRTVTISSAANWRSGDDDGKRPRHQDYYARN
jgi:hypothetical protein